MRTASFTRYAFVFLIHNRRSMNYMPQRTYQTKRLCYRFPTSSTYIHVLAHRYSPLQTHNGRRKQTTRSNLGQQRFHTLCEYDLIS